MSLRTGAWQVAIEDKQGGKQETMTTVQSETPLQMAPPGTVTLMNQWKESLPILIHVRTYDQCMRNCQSCHLKMLNLKLSTSTLPLLLNIFFIYFLHVGFTLSIHDFEKMLSTKKKLPSNSKKSVFFFKIADRFLCSAEVVSEHLCGGTA